MLWVLSLTIITSSCGDATGISTGTSADGGGDAGLIAAGDGGPRRDAGLGPVEDLDAGQFALGTCKDQGKRLEATPLDLLVVLDVSYSMDYDQKWVAVRSAMKSFISKPQFYGLGIGLQYFPLRAQCSIDAYAQPAVPFATLPAATAQLTASLDLQQMSGGTPTVPVLEGTTRYARTWAQAHASRQTVIVLATDGVPDDTCAAAPAGGLSNTLENVKTVASGAAAASPPIRTFVIGVGKDLVALNQIAAAGGTGQALLVDTKINADLAFLEALNTIRNNALGCSFDVPYSQGVDPTNAHVRFIADEPGRSFIAERVSERASCAANGGWYFEGVVPNNKVTLCPISCDAMNNAGAGRLFVEFGCSIQ